MIFCCLYCFLKAFPNRHSVCHPKNNMYAPLLRTCGGSNHGSPVFIRFEYLVVNSPTHSLKSLDHFLLNKGQTMSFGPTQCSLHYKLGGVTS